MIHLLKLVIEKIQMKLVNMYIFVTTIYALSFVIFPSINVHFDSCRFSHILHTMVADSHGTPVSSLTKGAKPKFGNLRGHVLCN